MLGDFFKRLRADTPPTRVGSVNNSALPATPSARVAEPAPRDDAVRAVEPDAREMRGWLELEVRTKIAELHNVLARDDRLSDAPSFLDALLESFDSVVRQPPLAAQRALAVTRDTNAHTGKLVALVEQDPGLTQALLRYANSAYYATRGGRVVSLHSAVQRVGTVGVHNVVLKTMVDGILCRPGSAYKDYVDLTWQHMIRVAPIARSLASGFSANPDEAFALGLLHDVGKLVVFDRLGELRKTLRREVVFPANILKVVLKSLHEPLGGLAALQWGLGAGVAHAIASHHRAPVPEMFDLRCELLFISERADLCRLGGEEFPLDDWWRDGALTTPRARVDVLLSALPDEAEEGAVQS